MDNKIFKYDVAIVGGGAVGLFLGIALHKAGINCVILEQRTEPRSGSRSLGIHPVSLELFSEYGFADDFVKEGVQIYQGHALTNDRALGTLSFEDCPGPFNFILSLPQHRTEAILEEKLSSLNKEILVRGATVEHIKQSKNEAAVTFKKNGATHTLSAQYLIGCDGKDSFVRDAAKITFRGSDYPDTYVMGDFTDNTEFGPEAAIFLCREGLIESFPLPKNRRRWVVKTEQYINNPCREDIENRLSKRIAHQISGMENYMVSSFGVQKFIADTMVNDNVILAGDAAHVVSPIGGQGMNLGWLGARHLAVCLKKIIVDGRDAEDVLKTFEKRSIKAAKNAIFRGELNMRLGRRINHPGLRNIAISLLLNTPVSKLMARVYTMRGVEKWWF